ncbi:hypothetical protein [Citrobacter freundii]|uniref:hypothetical protein n=1 Tax=Citrobacter freundii TaxID=546 RepID=UPI00301C2078
MFPSSDSKLILKMTALSVIFFIFPTACSVAAFSDDKTTETEKNRLIYNQGELYNIKKFASPNTIIGSPIDGLLYCEKGLDTFHKSSLLNPKSNNKLTNHYSSIPEANDIYNVVNVPESGPEWFSIIVSLLALLSSFIIPYLQHKNERKEAINEGYWIREVIMPKVNGLAFEVTAAFKRAIPLAEDDFLIALQDQLFPKLGELRESFYLFNSFSSVTTDIENLDNICDELEQKVSDNIDLPLETRINDISRFHLVLIQNLIDIHKKIG